MYMSSNAIEVKVYDVAGATIIPGLIDAHAHPHSEQSTLHVIEQQPTYFSAPLAYGVTTMVEVYGNEYRDAWLNDMIRSGKMEGPRYFTTGSVIYGGRAGARRLMYRPIATLDDARDWVGLAGQESPPTHFAIVVNGQAVGGIGLVFRDDINSCRAEIGYWLGEAYWGRGIVTESVRAVTAWTFENFDLASIYAGVLEWNPASMRVLEKAGYRFEARLRKAMIKEGVVMDEFIYSVIREDVE